MLLDLDKFYSSNYKDFVHKEALEQALKYVPEAFLKDVETKAILSITFSVDDMGENPIYVTYLDKDNKEHIVKLRPNITEQLTEVLKRYPTKVEMDEALNELKTTITNEYTIFVNAEVETLNNTINNVNNSLTQSIKDTLAEAKHYTDTKHEEALTKITEGDTETLTASKGYTDNLKEELTPVIAENKNRLYIGNTDNEKVEIEKTGHVTFEVDDGIKAIEVKQNDTEEMPSERIDFDEYAKKSDIPTNTVTTDYLNEQLKNYETKADATIDHNKLAEVPNGHKNPYILWYPDIDSNYIRMVNDNGEVRFHINNSQTNLETIGYLSSRNPTDFSTRAEAEDANKIYGYNTSDTSWLKCNGNFTISYDGTKITDLGYRQNVEDEEKQIHFSNYASKTDIDPLQSKLENIWASHKAPFIYWLPNIDINTMKLENAENDVKVTLNDGDVVYWRKNEYEPSGANLIVKYDTEPNTPENSISVRADSELKSVSDIYFTIDEETAHFSSSNYAIRSETPNWSWNTYPVTHPTSIYLNDMDTYLFMRVRGPGSKSVEAYLPTSEPVSTQEIEAMIQEQNAMNVENVSVSLQQKTRSSQEVTNNSTLAETKDFKILTLDFSFVPSTLPTSVEGEFVANIVIDAPEFNGKSFNITYKANEHSTATRGTIGEPLTIKTCTIPADETIKSIDVVVKEKIIIRKETE